MSDENLPPRIAVDLSSERISYHQDTVDYIVNSEINRCRSENIFLTKKEISDFKTKIVKLLLIQNKAEEAVNLRIKQK